MHRIGRAAVAVALLVGVVACGDDDDDGDGLTKDALIEQGDVICQRAVDDTTPLFAALFPTGTETPPAEEAAGPMGEAAEILRAEYEEFAALQPPSGDEEDFEAILERFEESIELIERSAELAAEGDTEGYLEQLGAANEADAASRELMAEYGFTTCAGGA